MEKILGVLLWLHDRTSLCGKMKCLGVYKERRNVDVFREFIKVLSPIPGIWLCDCAQSRSNLGGNQQTEFVPSSPEGAGASILAAPV